MEGAKGFIVTSRADRLIMVQFSFQNRDNVPPTINNLAKENKEEAITRRARKEQNARNNILMEHGGNNTQQQEAFSLINLAGDLTRGDYELVKTLFQERTNVQSGKKFWMVRFIFVRREFVRRDDEEIQRFSRWRGIALCIMRGMCEIALWRRVRVYRNPYFENDEEVPGAKAISVNFDARLPLFEQSDPFASLTPQYRAGYAMRLLQNKLVWAGAE